MKKLPLIVVLTYIALDRQTNVIHE